MMLLSRIGRCAAWCAAWGFLLPLGLVTGCTPPWNQDQAPPGVTHPSDTQVEPPEEENSDEAQMLQREKEKEEGAQKAKPRAPSSTKPKA